MINKLISVAVVLILIAIAGTYHWSLYSCRYYLYLETNLSKSPPKDFILVTDNGKKHGPSYVRKSKIYHVYWRFNGFVNLEGYHLILPQDIEPESVKRLTIISHEGEELDQIIKVNIQTADNDLLVAWPEGISRAVRYDFLLKHLFHFIKIVGVLAPVFIALCIGNVIPTKRSQ